MAHAKNLPLTELLIQVFVHEVNSLIKVYTWSRSLSTRQISLSGLSVPIRVCALDRPCSDEGLTLETSASPNSLWQLIYLYQLQVENLFYLPVDAAQHVQ